MNIYTYIHIYIHNWNCISNYTCHRSHGMWCHFNDNVFVRLFFFMYVFCASEFRKRRRVAQASKPPSLTQLQRSVLAPNFVRPAASLETGEARILQSSFFKRLKPGSRPGVWGWLLAHDVLLRQNGSSWRIILRLVVSLYWVLTRLGYLPQCEIYINGHDPFIEDTSMVCEGT